MNRWGWEDRVFFGAMGTVFAAFVVTFATLCYYAATSTCVEWGTRQVNQCINPGTHYCQAYEMQTQRYCKRSERR